MASNLLDVEESADYTHLKPSTIRSWILSNKISFVKLGRRVFLLREDLDAMIQRSVIPAKLPVQAKKRRNDVSENRT
jgi:excisionase family DNA binding protein